jgi:cell division inhibitor SepF
MTKGEFQMAGFLNKVLSLAGVYGEEEYMDEAYDEEEEDRQNVGYGNVNAFSGTPNNGNVLNPSFRGQGNGFQGGGLQGNPSANKNPNNVVNLPQKDANNYVLVSARPERYDDAQLICDHLKERHVVIFNLEEMDAELAQRIVDFISGSVYALDGEIIKFSRGIFGVAPNNVDLVAIKSDPKGKGFLSFVNSGYKN